MNVLLLTDNLLTRTNLEATIENADSRVISDRHAAKPELIVVDLMAAGALAEIRSWRARSPSSEIIAFGPHVDGNRFKGARQAGATSLVARSKIADRLMEHLNKPCSV